MSRLIRALVTFALLTGPMASAFAAPAPVASGAVKKVAKANVKKAKASEQGRATQATAPTTSAEPTNPAAQLGEITEVWPTGQIRFFIGEIPIQVNEELRLDNGLDRRSLFLRVNKVEPPFAEAVMSRLSLTPYSTVAPIRPGQKVIVEVKNKDIKTFGFHMGANFAEPVGGFGGTNYALGLNISGWFNPQLGWEARLNIESLGKDAASIEKRRGLYMLGLGHDLFQEHVSGLHIAGLVGFVDTMTITEGGNSTAIDPYTGTQYSTGNDVKHGNRGGYMLVASKRFMLKEVSRTSPSGWALTPFVSYSDTFERTSYKPVVTMALAIEVLSD